MLTVAILHQIHDALHVDGAKFVHEGLHILILHSQGSSTGLRSPILGRSSGFEGILCILGFLESLMSLMRKNLLFGSIATFLRALLARTSLRVTSWPCKRSSSRVSTAWRVSKLLYILERAIRSVRNRVSVCRSCSAICSRSFRLHGA
jgi:hypothetical protein